MAAQQEKHKHRGRPSDRVKKAQGRTVKWHVRVPIEDDIMVEQILAVRDERDERDGHAPRHNKSSILAEALAVGLREIRLQMAWQRLEQAQRMGVPAAKAWSRVVALVNLRPDVIYREGQARGKQLTVPDAGIPEPEPEGLWRIKIEQQENAHKEAIEARDARIRELEGLVLESTDVDQRVIQDALV